MLALNHRQRLFVQAYLRSGNATQAAMEAGYSSNRVCAKVQGSRLMARKDIQTAISYGRGNDELLARAMGLDVVIEAGRIAVDRKVRPAVRLRYVRLILRVAGLLPGRRRR